jgi:multiple sugar transport system substrate-binding protein
MADPERRWSLRYRVLVIAVYLVFVVVLASVSAQAVAEANGPDAAGTVLRWIPIGLALMISGISINLVPKIVGALWKRPEAANIGFVDLGGWLWGKLRQPARVVAVLVVVAALVAAGLAIRPQSSDLEAGPLRIMTGFGNSPNDPRSVLIDQWNRLHPSNQVEIDFASGETDQQHERMVNDAKPGGVHRADVYVLDVVWMAEFVDRGYVRELTVPEQDLADFVPNVIGTCRRSGKLWALPFNTDAGLLFHRSDIPGVSRPESWDDYSGAGAVAAVAAARSAGHAIEAADAAQLGDEEMLTITALEAIWAAGGRVVGGNGQVLLNPNGTAVDFGVAERRGIEKLAAAARNRDVVPADARQTTSSQAAEAFAAGRTLFMRNWPVARDAVGKRVYFEAVAPPHPSVLGGQNLAVSASTDKPRAAQALIEFLTNASSQLILSEVGGFAPTRQSAYINARRLYSQELRTAVDRAQLRPVTPCYTEFSRAFRKGINRALNAGGELEPGFAEELARIWKCA